MYRRIVLLALVLTACGTPQSPDVASIAAPSTSAGAGAAERPLIRADTSIDERVRLQNVFHQCLREQGIPMLDQEGVLKPLEETGPKVEAARRTCAAKEPEDYKERLSRRA